MLLYPDACNSFPSYPIFHIYTNIYPVTDGDQIQANLLETLNHGDVSVTCSVIRKTLQNVIKTCITSEGGDAIKSAVNAALQCASKKRFASVGIQNLSEPTYEILCINFMKLGQVYESFLEKMSAIVGYFFT